MLAPDRQIGFGDAGVGRQDEHSRLRLWNQVHGQLGLGTNGIQPRCIKNNQPLLKERVSHVDQGVTPLRHLHHALRVRQGVVSGSVVMPEAERAGFVRSDSERFSHFLHRTGELFSVGDVQVDAVPLFRHQTPFHQGLGLQSRFDRQQPQTGRHIRVISDLGRTHGRAPSARRHDAPTVVGKKHRVDQLGLPPRELSNKGHHDLVGTNLGLQTLEAVLQRRIEQLMILHPVAQQLQAQAELPAPCTMLVELLVE